MEKNIVKINEDTLRQIVTESVKKVLNEEFFGSRLVNDREALNTLNKMAVRYGYQRVRYEKGMLHLVALDRNEEPVDIKTNIPLPKTVHSGMLGTGKTGWSEKSFEVLRQQLQKDLEQRKQIHTDAMREKAQREKEDKERWKRDAEIEAQWKKNRQGYYPTGQINDYRG